MSEARFRIKRFDPASDAAPRYETFIVPYEGNLTVLEGLFSIQERQDGSLCFRYCCRAAVCGSCAMYINGRYRLACQTNVRHLPAGDITVEPHAAPAAGQGPRLRHDRLLRQVRVHQALADARGRGRARA